MQLVINKSNGGFSLSQEALIRIAELKQGTNIRLSNSTYVLLNSAVTFISNGEEVTLDAYSFQSAELRCDKHLVQAVSELGVKAETEFSSLKIIEIPDNVKYKILNTEGVETVVDVNAYWE